VCGRTHAGVHTHTRTRARTFGAGVERTAEVGGVSLLDRIPHGVHVVICVDAARAKVRHVHPALLRHVSQRERAQHVGADGLQLMRLAPVDLSNCYTIPLREAAQLQLTLGRPVTPAALITCVGCTRSSSASTASRLSIRAAAAAELGWAMGRA